MCSRRGREGVRGFGGQVALLLQRTRICCNLGQRPRGDVSVDSVPRCIEHIKAGEEVTHSYVDSILPTPARQQHLQVVDTTATTPTPPRPYTPRHTLSASPACMARHTCRAHDLSPSRAASWRGAGRLLFHVHMQQVRKRQRQ